MCVQEVAELKAEDIEPPEAPDAVSSDTLCE